MMWFRPPRLGAIERAILGSKPKKASRLAERLVRREPENETAWFLLACSSLTLQRFERSVQAAAECLRFATGDRKSGPAYVQILSHLELGQRAEAARLLPLAAKDPAVRKVMKNDGRVKDLPGADRYLGEGFAYG